MFHENTVSSPSLYEPESWGDKKRRRYIIQRIRTRPPTGLFPFYDEMPMRARQGGQWLPAIRQRLENGDGSATCASCGKTQTVPDTRDPLPRYPSIRYPFDVDHIVPLACDGPHHMDNLQLLCPGCHRRKTAGER
jgi:5-methylcytosine-specific restriction endonuclease McrA